MDNKILVEISVPAADKTFDVYIPLDSKLAEVSRLTAIALSDLSGEKFKADAGTILCDADTGDVFDRNKEIAELGIHTGSHLMLI